MVDERDQYLGSSIRLNWSHEPVRIQMLKVADYWLRHVDGLYLKNLNQVYVEHNETRDDLLRDFLQRLRRIVAYHQQLKSQELGLKVGLASKKILICDSELVGSYLSRIKRRRQTRDGGGGSVSSGPQIGVLDYPDDMLSSVLMSHHVMPSNQSNPTQSNISVAKIHNMDLYAYFDLVHFVLNIQHNKTDTIRDQVNDVFLNRPAHFPTILWSINSVQQARLATRFGARWTLASIFLLTMMPGTVSIFYGDEIGLQDVYDIYTQNVSAPILFYLIPNTQIVSIFF